MDAGSTPAISTNLHACGAGHSRRPGPGASFLGEAKYWRIKGGTAGMCLFRPAAGSTALQHGVERTDGVRVFSGDAQRQQPLGFQKEPFFVEKQENYFFF